jgi:hypothetical protein
MELIYAVTTYWHRTDKYLYTTEVRNYRTTEYVVHFGASYVGTVFKSREEAENELAQAGYGWIEPCEYIEFITLHHRYKNREGR